MNERKPLTLDELRFMANKPYWHVGLREDSGAPHWSILDPLLAYHPEDYDYGKTWLAYAAEAPRLDRSAWEPCGECRSCDNCKNNSDYSPDEGIYGECSQCHEYSNFEPFNFCHECGRPLTDAAWEMLERRLARHEQQ